MNNRVYLYLGYHWGRDEVPALNDWLSLLKRSVLLFDEVFISDQVAKHITGQPTLSSPSESRKDLAQISRELSAVQAKEERILEELPGIGLGKVVATASEVVKQVILNRERPVSESERQTFNFHLQRLKVKFSHDENADLPLLEHQHKLDLSYSDLLDETISSRLDASLHRSGLDGLNAAGDESGVTLATLDELLEIRVPSFDFMPLDEVLDLRTKSGWVYLRRFVTDLSAKLKEAALNDNITKDDLRTLIDRRVINEISDELLAGKKSALKLALSYVKGLIGLIPLVGEILTAYDLGMETHSFIKDRRHWITFLSRLESTASIRA